MVRRKNVMSKVLIIEDEETIRWVLEEILIDEGYQVITAENGSQGLAKLREEDPLPGLVITDLRMEGITGRDIIEEMRSQPELENVPAIIITGAVEGTNEFPPEDTYQGFITKPFDLMDVIEKVNNLCS